ncbi:hypothetical protein TNCV_1626201 [Trichonephila clavipes]|nr:hypothetical protein TNCV_1626201 [Trichonephila clavipes]
MAPQLLRVKGALFWTARVTNEGGKIRSEHFLFLGARVIGCCAHVTSVLWYLGYWCHNHTWTKAPSLGYADTLQDAATGWYRDDSASESEKET